MAWTWIGGARVMQADAKIGAVRCRGVLGEARQRLNKNRSQRPRVRISLSNPRAVDTVIAPMAAPKCNELSTVYALPK